VSRRVWLSFACMQEPQSPGAAPSFSHAASCGGSGMRRRRGNRGGAGRQAARDCSARCAGVPGSAARRRAAHSQDVTATGQTDPAERTKVRSRRWHLAGPGYLLGIAHISS
jgi:hypothetical protein